MGRTARVLVGLGLLTLSACSGSADPSPPPSSPTLSSTPPTVTSSPTAPVMPDAAKAHTKAGAKAFVEYFWEVVNYAQATGDTDVVRLITNSGCDGCAAGLSAIDKTYAQGGRVVGGTATVSDLRARLLTAGQVHLAQVAYSIRIADQRDDFPGSVKDVVEPGYRSRDRLELVEDETGWSAIKLEVLK